VHQEDEHLYRLTIDGTLWSSVEYSHGRNAWCIEDCRNKCLMHIDGIHGEAPKASVAIGTAKAMIRDGRMPDPETVQARLRDPNRRRRRPGAND
jgi:hypothetical protein